VKKSAAARPSQCAARNVFQDGRAPLRCRLDAVILEDRLNRVAADLVTEPFEPSADARVVPGRVLIRHADLSFAKTAPTLTGRELHQGF